MDLTTGFLAWLGMLAAMFVGYLIAGGIGGIVALGLVLAAPFIARALPRRGSRRNDETPRP